MAGTDFSVLHIASGDLWAGAEVQLFMLARAQCRAGQSVAVLVMNPGVLATKLRAEGLVVHVLPEAQLSPARLFAGIYSLMRQIRPAIVHTHRHKENILGGVAAWLNGIPSVRTAHGAPEFHYGLRHPGKLARHVLDTWVGAHLQRRVVAVTPELATKLASTFPLNSIVTIGNGIDPETFESFPPGEGPVPAFGQARRRIGIVGRLVPVKRVDLFIAAASQLARDPDFADVHFFILGDGPLRARLEEQAAPLSGRVHFLGAIARVHPYVAGLDALVMCSDHEGMPMVALEAMSLGCPVVAHQVGGLTDLLNEGRCGWPVTDQDAGAYARAIARALSNESQRAAVVAQAARQVLEQHTATLCARRHLEMYSRVLEGPDHLSSGQRQSGE